MIKIITIALLALTITACSTTGGSGSNIDPATAAQFLRTGTSIGAYEGLKNNPKYVPGGVALVSALDIALTGSAVITDQTISAFVARIALQNHIDSAETLFFTNIARTGYQAYLAKFHPSGAITMNDPQVKLFAQAFRDGLADGLSMQSAPVETK